MTALDALDLALPVTAALWGAATGTLLPRAAHRFSVPAGEDWRKECPAGHPIRGWLGTAHCAACTTPAPTPAEPVAADGEDAPQGPPAPAPAPAPAPLALTTALVCTALALATGPRPELAVWLLLAPVGVLLAVVDFRVQRLPDPLTLPLAAAALALLGAAALLPEHAGHWLTSLYAALALGACYFLLFLVNPGGMGFGDVKLALGTGAVLGWYGWPTVLFGTFAGFLLGALYGGALVVVRRAGRKTAIAFGPFLIAGAFAGLLVGAYTA
ncbi:A24 family peptidase [Streptomyces sp. NPDC048277]|uniref:prepilin peptidase n=1 Tax=Streptomyces sp. NPDC048277 TaxID=3155027 RepID=UPI0033EF0DB8